MRKFEKNLKTTGRKMRIEETKMFRQSLRPPEACVYKYSLGDLKPCIRDYIRLCRGEKLVGIIIFYMTVKPL